MNASILASSFLLLAASAAAQSVVSIGPDGVGCSEAALLANGLVASGTVTFDYNAITAQLLVTVDNTSPVDPETTNPVITRVYFNAPKAAVSSASLLAQWTEGETQPGFVFGFDSDAGDGADPNRAACLGTFNFRLASAGIADGIAAPRAPICADLKGPPLVGPVMFLLQLVGPDVHGLSSEVFAASMSHNAELKNVNVALKFDGARCEINGTLGNGEECRTAVFLRGTPKLGNDIAIAVEGGNRCRAFLGVSFTPGPLDFKFFTLPIGLPIFFTYDFGFFPLGENEFTLPVTVPFLPELIGLEFFMTNLTHPWMQDGPYGFAPAFSFTITGDFEQLPQ